MKTRAKCAMGFLIAALAAASAMTAQAGIIYSEKFDTPVTADAFTSTYGYTVVGTYAAAPYVTAGGEATWKINSWGGGHMYQANANLSNWKWSDGALTFSALLGGEKEYGGSSRGLFLSTSAGGPTAAGVFLGFNETDGSTDRAVFGVSNYNNDSTRIYDANAYGNLISTYAEHLFSMTISETVGDSSKFDVTATIDGNSVFTGGLLSGLSKATYGITGTNPFNSFGHREDGQQQIWFDNPTISVIPEPASGLMLLGSMLGIGLLRRKLHG